MTGRVRYSTPSGCSRVERSGARVECDRRRSEFSTARRGRAELSKIGARPGPMSTQAYSGVAESAGRSKRAKPGNAPEWLSVSPLAGGRPFERRGSGPPPDRVERVDRLDSSSSNPPNSTDDQEDLLALLWCLPSKSCRQTRESYDPDLVSTIRRMD
jgi:hypothetical protein